MWRRKVLERGWRWTTYGEFTGSPKPLNQTQVVDCHCSEEEFRGVGVACLPDEESPDLLVAPEVRDDLDVKEVLGICDADQNRGGNDAEE